MKDNRHKRKFKDFVIAASMNLDSPKILEFGVSERGMSTELFIELCEKKNGKLISVDINNNTIKFKSKNW